MITTLAEANAMLAEAIADYESDCGGASDDVWHDLIVATAFFIIEERTAENIALAREFCRTQIGSIPHDLEPFLGRRDWIQ